MRLFKKKETVKSENLGQYFCDPPLKAEDAFAYHDILFVLEKSKEVKRKGLAKTEIVLLKEVSDMLHDFIQEKEKQQDEFEKFLNDGN